MRQRTGPSRTLASRVPALPVTPFRATPAPGGLRRRSPAVLPALAVALALWPTPPAVAQQPVDSAYTAAIREYTTEPFFLTPLVDHLPASATVPTPLEFNGRIAGAPEHLHYSSEVHAYMRAVAAATPRVQVRTMGTSEGGKEMLLVIVGDEAAVAGFDANAEALKRLADPRVTTEMEAEALIRSTKPVYWATGAIHSPETGSPEMLMELVYRLAVSEDPHPGHPGQHDRDDHPGAWSPTGARRWWTWPWPPGRTRGRGVPERPLWWGQYVAHSNNRDGMGLSLNLTRSLNRTFLEYHPTVLHDLHESASYLYTSTGRGPYNPNLDPVVINEWNRLAYREVGQMTAWGVPGVYTYDFYDGWAPTT
jgi:hypothetical protein